MAGVPYQGAPTVSPTGDVPDDYQHQRANPEDFGAAIGTGLSKAGADVSNLGQFWGQIQGDSVLNDALKQGDAAVEHFKSLRGQDALDAQAGLNQNLDDIQKNARDQLGTQQQRLDFDKQFRPYRDRYWAGQISTHANQQGYEFASKTNQDGFEQSLTMAANSIDDPSHIEVARHKAIDWQFKLLALNGQENDPAAQAEAIQKANIGIDKTVAEAMAVKDPFKAQQYVEAHKGTLGPAYAPLAEQLRVRAEDAAASKAATDAMAHAGTQPVHPSYGPVFTRYNQYLQNGDVQSALRLSEGLRTNAYWDVNHWRTGYGSDTVTHADGSVEPVTATTRITPQEAELDLQRRTALAAKNAQQTIGPAWDGMNAGTRAALTSVVYNYGHVPNDIAAAAASGDGQALAKAIASHAQDNAGVNAKRRLAEAGAVVGGFGLGGVEARQPGIAPPEAAQGGGSPSVQPIPSPPEPAPPKPEDAAFTPPTMEKVAPTPEDMRANAVANIWQRDDLTERQKIIAERQIEATYQAAKISAEQDEKAKKARKEQAYNQVDGLLLQGKYSDAFNMVMNPNTGLDEQERLALADNIERRSGMSAPLSFGAKYHDYQSRILASPGDPTRLVDPIEIYRAENRGELTPKGGDDLRKMMASIRKETDEYGLQIRVNTMLGYAKDKMIHEDLGGGVRINDLNGREAFTKFTNTYLDQLNYWRQQGVGPDKFSLFDTKNVDALIEQIYPKRKMQQDMLRATGETGAPEPANAPLPPPPEQVKDEKAWANVVRQTPGTMNHAMWANKLSMLTSDPDKFIPVWNASQFGQHGYMAQDILDRLGVPYDKSAYHGFARPEAPAAQHPVGQHDIPVRLPIGAILPHVPFGEALRAGFSRMTPAERAALEKASGKKVEGP